MIAKPVITEVPTFTLSPAIIGPIIVAAPLTLTSPAGIAGCSCMLHLPDSSVAGWEVSSKPDSLRVGLNTDWAWLRS